MKRLKAGIIGMGFVGPIHLEALRRLGSIDVCIATSGPDSARAAAERYGVDEWHGDWQSLVADPTVDVVHICAPNHLHDPIARQAMLLGKHVVCDKPLTLDIAQARELVALARERGVVNAVTFNTSCYPQVAQMAHLVASGETGPVRYLQGRYLQDWLSEETDYNWRVEAAAGGPSRVIGDIGSHWLFLAETVIGQRVTRLYADFNRFIPQRQKPLRARATYASVPDTADTEAVQVDTEDQATLLLEFDGGAKGVFVGGQTFAGYKNLLELDVFGGRRSLAWNSQQPDHLWIGERREANRLLMKDFHLMEPTAAARCDFTGGLQEGFAETWKVLFRLVYDAIRSGRHVEGLYPTFADGLHIQTVVDAAWDSSVRREWIAVSPGP